ncbi:MAG: FIST N-terminal domain-containing protein, partial [Bacteroidota bacterium]
MFWSSHIAQKAVQFWRSKDRSEHEVLLLLLGEDSLPEVSEIISQLNAADIPFLGGIFPGVIYGEAHQSQGAIAKALYAPLGVHLIREVADIPQLSRKLEQARPGFISEAKGTAITLVDGLMQGISGLLQEAYDYLGHAYEFLGGGAGSISLEQAPCLFSPEGFFQDAALICLVDQSSKAGIRHGWKKIYGPVVATLAEGNTIHELNWENAFTIYQEVVESDSQQQFDQQAFFDLAKAYPF